jgi:hypothetical protein
MARKTFKKSAKVAKAVAKKGAAKAAKPRKAVAQSSARNTTSPISMAHPTFRKLLQIADGDQPDTVEIAFRGDDDVDYSVQLMSDLVPTLTIALQGRCRRSLAEYQAARETIQQPFRIRTGRPKLMGDVPCISFLTTMGVELVMEFSRDQLPGLRQITAELETALMHASKSSKPS